MNAFLHSSGKVARPLLAAAVLVLFAPSLLRAEVTTYTDETAYQIELLRLGYTTVVESFEDDAVWGAVRTTIVGGQMTAPSVTSQGITWTHNFPEVSGNNITTGPGPARTGNYGFFALPHGNYLSGGCTVPGVCGDGFICTSPAGTPMFAVGGWVKGNQAKLGVFLDGSTTSVDFSSSALTNAYKFFGVIDTAGFNEVKFRELEGTGEDAKIIFSDDFTFGMAASGCGSNNPPTAAFTFAQTAADVTFTDASSDTDGTVIQWLWDFGDGNFSNQLNPSHTYVSNGNYSVVLYVRDDGNCAGASPPQLIFVTSYPPADIAITSPTNGAIVNGTITLEVAIVDPPAAVEQVKYFLDDVELDKSEEDPFSLSWDTTGTPDGVHTLVARLTKFDETEIFSDPVTFTVSNAPPATPLEAWRGQHFSAADLADPTKEATVWGNTADPDRDGKDNWFEYVFGGVPTVPDALAMELDVAVVHESGDPFLQFSFNRRTDDPSLVYSPEVSASFGIWHGGGTYVQEVSAVPVNAEFERVTAKDLWGSLGSGSTFGRVTVSGNTD